MSFGKPNDSSPNGKGNVDETFQRAFEPPDDKSGLTHVLLRLTLLIALLVLIHGWFLLHRGLDLKVVGIEAAVGLLAALRPLLKKGDDLAVDRSMKSAFALVLTTPMLVVLWAAFLLFGTFISTVEVTAAGAKDVAQATLIDLQSNASASEPILNADDVARFTRFTSPFGRQFSLTAGRYSQPVRLWPWWPTRIRVGIDMATPTLLIRVPYPHYDLVGGEIRVRDVDRNAELIRIPTTAKSAALLIGPASIPDAQKDAWQLELNAMQVPVGAQAAAILAWKAALQPPTPISMPAKTTLEVIFLEESQVKSNGPNPAARKRYMLTSEPFQDVLLDDKRPSL